MGNGLRSETLNIAAGAWFQHLKSTYNPPCQVWQVENELAREADYSLNASLGMLDPKFHPEVMARVRAMDGAFSPIG